MEASGSSAPARTYDRHGRRQVDLAELAGSLDLRLHFASVDLPALREGCGLAAELGLGSVTCRPEHVEAASSELAGTPVAVSTSLAFHSPSVSPVAAADLVDDAAALVSQGAEEFALTVTAARLQVDEDRRGGSPFLDAVDRLAGQQSQDGFRLRLHLDTWHLTRERVAAVCSRAASAGVWMVQAGSWQGHRASYLDLQTIRALLGPGPLLKWTTPVPSPFVMLMAMSAGADRFNTDDVSTLLREAKRQLDVGPLLVPVRGMDY